MSCIAALILTSVHMSKMIQQNDSGEKKVYFKYFLIFPVNCVDFVAGKVRYFWISSIIERGYPYHFWVIQQKADIEIFSWTQSIIRLHKAASFNTVKRRVDVKLVRKDRCDLLFRVNRNSLTVKRHLRLTYIRKLWALPRWRIKVNIIVHSLRFSIFLPR